ncbi:glycosyltransferase family 4 protein [Terrabacter sp. C0L_2]|uniref:glycosyltransferase family 4 protein n=1 Tax=Terrabacter sp. C0L_2 TaxID=3108389 RepID=UPI002ED22239|nr:glycosyltransferase family 4 protein [Terrabacter sp. C0L_2]
MTETRPTDTTRPSGRRLRIAALFVSDWDHEFEDVATGRTPSHRLFGMQELEVRGHRVLHHTRSGRPRRARRTPWRLSQLLWLLRVQREVDVVLATHEAAALPALVLSRVGLVRRPVVVMTVAALEATTRPGLAGTVHRTALRGADAITVFSSAQREPLARRLGGLRRSPTWVPLGVDVEFFRSVAGDREGGILSVGTNAGKDFPTLMAALPRGMTCMVVTDAWNRAQAEPLAHRPDVTFRSDVPITELRELYSRAELMVLPLRESRMSSGQTVLLENLALGTPVVISDVSGVGDYLDPEVMCVVPPGDPDRLREALVDPGWRERALKGPALVASRFTAMHLASALETVCLDLVAAAADGRQARPLDESSPTLS